jgi:hypothetical protein
MTWAAGSWAASAMLFVAAVLVVLDGDLELAGLLSVGSAVGVLAGGLCNRRRLRQIGHR